MSHTDVWKVWWNGKQKYLDEYRKFLRLLLSYCLLIKYFSLSYITSIA